MSRLKSFADKMFNGDITLMSNGPQGIQKFSAENDVFGTARDIARDNSGDVVIFKGTFPDGRERAQATVSVPKGQGPNAFRERLAKTFGVESGAISGNHFTRGNEGHHYLSLTIDM